MLRSFRGVRVKGVIPDMGTRKGRPYKSRCL